MYVSPERVSKNGYLIAFAGEIMTEAEALARGLKLQEPKAEKPKKKAK